MKEKKDRKSYMKAGLACLLCSILVASVHVPSFPKFGWMVRLAAGAIALSVLVRSLKRRVSPDRNRIKHDPPPPLSEHTVESLQKNIQIGVGRNEWTTRQAKLFAHGIMYPSQLRQRVVEEYETGRRTLRQKVTVDFQIGSKFLPSDGRGTLLIPLLVPKKGDLHDDLEVFDANGESVSTYTYREYLLLAATTLRVLLASALKTRGKLDVNAFAEESAESLVENLALEIISQRGPSQSAKVNKVFLTQITALISGEESIGAAGGASSHPPGDRTFPIELVRRLSSHYAIVAVVEAPSDGRVTLSYTRTIIPTQIPVPREGVRPWALMKSQLRTALGARPVFVNVQIENAWTCNSYHLHVQGPEGLYLARQQFDADYLKPPKKTDTPEPARLNIKDSIYIPNPYFRFRRRLGQRYAHFYTRFFPAPREGQEPPDVTFTFYETPPGSDLQATIAAVSAFLLVWLVGIAVAYSKGLTEIGSDAPVLLLAFPGAAASWIGFDTPARLLAGSLSARVSLIFTAAVSLSASALFMLNRVNAWTRILQPHFFLGLSIMGMKNPWWAALSLVALANALTISYRWIVRSITYGHLASRPPLGEDRAVQLK